MDPSKMSHEELMEAFMDKIAYVDEGDIETMTTMKRRLSSAMKRCGLF